jgi:hypothetical protein
MPIGRVIKDKLTEPQINKLRSTRARTRAWTGDEEEAANLLTDPVNWHINNTLKGKITMEKHKLDSLLKFRHRLLDRRLPTANSVHAFAKSEPDSPLKTNLRRKYPTPHCTRCNRNIAESVPHVFMECPASQEYRENAQTLIEQAILNKTCNISFINHVQRPPNDNTPIYGATEDERFFLMNGFIPPQVQILCKLLNPFNYKPILQQLSVSLIRNSMTLWNDSRKHYDAE